MELYNHTGTHTFHDVEAAIQPRLFHDNSLSDGFPMH
jgi:hypothetical protein